MWCRAGAAGEEGEADEAGAAVASIGVWRAVGVTRVRESVASGATGAAAVPVPLKRTRLTRWAKRTRLAPSSPALATGAGAAQAPMRRAAGA